MNVNMYLVNRIVNMLVHELSVRDIHDRLCSDWSEESIFIAIKAAQVRLAFEGA